ncbi:MAG: extracellular solute-binding protein [Anaerolineae bacterium]|jgi:basic membrane protein A
MRTRLFAALSVLLALAMVLSGCTQPTPTPVPAAPTAKPEAAAEAPAATPEPEVVKVGLVTDMGGVDDLSFNQTSWKGVQDAIEQLGIEGSYLESQQQTDYAKNITEYLQQGVDLILTVGYLLGEDTANFAKANPDVKFAIVDFGYDEPMPNVLGLTYATDQATFLAGYLAAGMTKTGVVGTFGGIEIPSVTIFMDGFAQGVWQYNQVHGTNVKVLGTDYYVGNFESTDDGRRAAESLMDEGADIIMPVAGPVGNGTAAVLQERGGMLIGVDADWTITAPQYANVVLTSVLKNMDVSVVGVIEQVADGTFAGGTYVGTLANNGVGLAPGTMEDKIPAELKAELEDLRKQVIAKQVWTGWGEAPTGVETGVVLGESVNMVFWHNQAPDSFRGELLDEIIADFEAKYPEINVIATYQGDYTSLYKKLVAAIAAGGTPDLAVSYPSMVSDYLKAGVVQELDPYINDPDLGLTAEDLSDIYPGYLAEGRFPAYGNKYFTFPFAKSAEGMWYNLDLLKEAGYDAPPKTWAEFEEMCLAVHDKTGKIGYAYYENASTLDSWLLSRGTSRTNADQTEAIFNGPEAVETLAMMKRLIDAGAAVKPEGSYADQAEFGKGNVAFTFGSTSGTYYYQQAVEESGGLVKEYGHTLPPQSNPDRPGTVLYGGSLVMFKTTEAKQKAAWLFMKFFSSTEQTAKWGSASGYMPVRASASALLDDYFTENPIVKEQVEVIMPAAQPGPAVAGEQEMRTYAEEAMTKVFEGIADAQTALDEAVELSNEALARGRE